MDQTSRQLLLGVVAWGGLQGIDARADEKKPEAKEAPKEGAGDEDEIPLTRVPPKVRKGADAAAPKVKWEAAYRATEEGKTTYELEGVDAKGREIVVLLTSEGELIEIETEIPPRDVPEVVREAVKARWPRFKASAAFEIKRDGVVTGYDLEGKRPADKHEIGISVSADGKELEIDDNE